MAAPTPTPRSVSQIKSSLLSPALTSHYELYLTMPRGNAGDINAFMRGNGVNFSTEQANIQLACSEATLPGSSLATHEITNDYTGVTERHVYRRIYDDRIDLTFYVNTKYTVIRFFETWIKYIVNESVSRGNDGRAGVAEQNYFYTVRYPEEYKTNFSIVKVEKDYKTKLTYTFINAFPMSITSMPISYDSSSLLKCTVSFNYSRYYIEELNGKNPENSSNLNSPLDQSNFNAFTYQNLIDPGFALNTTGGLAIQDVLSSGNSIQVYENEEIIGAINANQTPIEAGLPYVGRNRGPLAPF